MALSARDEVFVRQFDQLFLESHVKIGSSRLKVYGFALLGTPVTLASLLLDLKVRTYCRTLR